ncbi:MAG: sigma 54-interacting transcriptional regulator [Acidobacteria bacterium]|nr:sigma 54-interacting transcriptional regulator [Acidobacteriota bacterium]
MGNKLSEISKLSTLVEISQVLSSTIDLKEGLAKLLEALERRQQMERGTITLLDQNRKEIAIEVAHDLTPAQVERGRYKLGEGITGTVVASGRPVIIPKLSREPMFLNRTGARRNLHKRELSFICVPIIINSQTVGALSIDLKFHKETNFNQKLEFLTITASMIARNVELNRLLELEKTRLLDENTYLKQELKEKYNFTNIIGSSSSIRAVYQLITQVATTNTTVLIRGESGTGKELVAHAVHYSSERSSKPFVKVNCAALPESLIESELFGYEKGAFTGANARKKGRFELAEGGTLFLDEIGDLSSSTQVKLLRVLQEREFERVGGVETLKANVRIITATNKDLEKAIEKGLFREDLYYRLNVFTIYLPPLRERRTDILLLTDHFLEKYAREHNKPIKRVSTPAIDMLMCYHWPGNVRELENCMERAVLICDGGVIHAHHLPPTLQTAEASNTEPRLDLITTVENYEKDLILDALKSSRGNQAKAAVLLGSTERIINYKVKKYQIDYRRFRS